MDQKIAEKIENPKLRGDVSTKSKRRLDGLPGRFWKLNVEHDAHIHFAQKPREMP